MGSYLGLALFYRVYFLHTATYANSMDPKKPRVVDKRVLNEIKGLPCVVCEQGPCDPAHIKSKGSGGDDVFNNLIPLCRSCHTEQHTMGWYAFTLKYHKAKLALYIRGWSINLHTGKLEKI